MTRPPAANTTRTALAARTPLATERIPIARTGASADVAHAVSFFAGEAVGHVSGQVILVTGGPKA